MKSKRDDGGQAFPCPGEGQFAPEIGMWLRDYFAAEAMQSLVTSAHMQSDSIGLGNYNDEKVAAFAYQLADAMIKERAK